MNLKSVVLPSQQTVVTLDRAEVLAGLVERVTFHNEDNRFCVLRVKARGKRDLITVIGNGPQISAGEFIQARATGSMIARTACSSVLGS